jgi:hypothetical protein
MTMAIDLEVPMANKDKGGRATKKVPAKSLKQKRLEKKMKKTSGGGTSGLGS